MGTDPTGRWRLTFEDSVATRQLLTAGNIDDIVLLLTYSAETPEWV